MQVCPNWTIYLGVQVEPELSSPLGEAGPAGVPTTDCPFSAMSLILCAPIVIAIVITSSISVSVAPCCLATARQYSVQG